MYSPSSVFAKSSISSTSSSDILSPRVVMHRLKSRTDIFPVPSLSKTLNASKISHSSSDFVYIPPRFVTNFSTSANVTRPLAEIRKQF